MRPPESSTEGKADLKSHSDSSPSRLDGNNKFGEDDVDWTMEVRLRLYEFVEQYHRAVVRLCAADVEAKTATEHSTPVLITQLKSLEKNATEVYTQYMFKLFQDEIQCTYPLVVEKCVDELQRLLYFIEVYSHPERKWTVEYFPIDSKMKCSCLMFESFGLPCCHMIMVMKQEQLLAIPPSLVIRRWTRSACLEAHHPMVGLIPQSLSSTHAARYGVLSSGYNLMSFYASHSRDSFEDVKDLGHEMTSWMRKRWEMGKNKECTTSLGETSYVQDLFGVGDPFVAKTKGNPGKNSTAPNSRKPRQCRHHNFRLQWQRREAKGTVPHVVLLASAVDYDGQSEGDEHGDADG
ncbi:hypothetical protein Vadar_013869 [Vaccinium darrowii]|uniref:Uncharacterized protein n=1 Tax=Vaccinium darrowii TaxID=229202 RepID=A0ACB7YVU9_9ERIC|nr:hypothetical protein Vadar_013869 [Vaccinium darrowii]